MASLSQQTGANPTQFQENVDFPSADASVDSEEIGKFGRAMAVARSSEVLAHLWGRIQNSLVREAAAARSGAEYPSMAGKDIELFIRLRDGLIGPEHYFIELAGLPESTQGSVQFFLQDGANKSGSAVNYHFIIAKERHHSAPGPEEICERAFGRAALVEDLQKDFSFSQQDAEQLIRDVASLEWRLVAR